MRSIPLTAALLFMMCASLRATESVVFDGGGYMIDILVGEADRPSVAAVRFSAPESDDLVSLPLESFRIEKIDLRQSILVMHFANPKDRELPPPFTLSVKGKKGVLSIDGKRIKGSFDWGD